LQDAAVLLDFRIFFIMRRQESGDKKRMDSGVPPKRRRASKPGMTISVAFMGKMKSEIINKRSYDDAVKYLYGLQKYGIKLGLENTIKLLSLLGNPQNSFRSVHIAGTNGKGSTSAMIASILRTAGFRVGLFTSPHMVSFTERIKVNDTEITENEVVELTNEIHKVIESARPSAENLRPHPPLGKGGQGKGGFLPTFFEFVTAMGFLYFKRKGVKWAVVETGMGGRLDATNVLRPEVSVITNISYDHREFLGGTLKEIAGEKAGIIKKGIPVVSSAQEPEAMEVISGKASEKGTSLFVFGKDFVSRPGNIDMHGITFDYEGKEKPGGLHVPLCGMHQLENASVAVKAMELISARESIPYSIREGLARTQWQGRLELIKNEHCNYDFLIDGAHNPSASKALADSLEKYFMPSYERMVLILGIMGDKDMEGIIKPLLPIASDVIFTAPDYERAAPPEKLAECAGTLGFRSEVVKTVKRAMDVAGETATRSAKKTLVLITGSFYTIGEAKTHLGRECSSPSLARLR
jgi:dihydrofolate synthase/folylpolyglutamate synthase